jgi:hypothetical protein
MAERGHMIRLRAIHGLAALDGRLRQRTLRPFDIYRAASGTDYPTAHGKA